MPTTSHRKLSSAPTAKALDMQILEEVKAQFAQWRVTRVHLRSKMPDTLWKAAKQLTKHYKFHLIAKELNLSGSRRQKLRVYCGHDNNNPAASTPVNDFVQVSVSHASPPAPLSDNPTPASAVGTLELLRTDGATLKAYGITPQNLYVLIERFLVS